MRFPEDAPVTPAKRAALRAQIAALGLRLEAVEEQPIRAGGAGGQKVNKTSSGVLLRYRLGDEVLIVKTTRERQRSINRFVALRELTEQVERRLFPGAGRRSLEAEKVRKQKDRRRRRASQG
jgi:peptide chain release factor